MAGAGKRKAKRTGKGGAGPAAGGEGKGSQDIQGLSDINQPTSREPSTTTQTSVPQQTPETTETAVTQSKGPPTYVKLNLEEDVSRRLPVSDNSRLVFWISRGLFAVYHVRFMPFTITPSPRFSTLSKIALAAKEMYNISTRGAYPVLSQSSRNPLHGTGGHFSKSEEGSHLLGSTPAAVQEDTFTSNRVSFTVPSSPVYIRPSFLPFAPFLPPSYISHLP
jgi:hypothetical protein